jgi:hypothetical protein
VRRADLPDCYPSVEMPSCRHCTRRRQGEPDDPLDRDAEVIDATVVAVNGICQLFNLNLPPLRLPARNEEPAHH